LQLDIQGDSRMDLAKNIESKTRSYYRELEDVVLEGAKRVQTTITNIQTEIVPTTWISNQYLTVKQEIIFKIKTDKSFLVVLEASIRDYLRLQVE
jgi:hypothetical protein